MFGASGSGKTEYARSLVKESGLKSILYKNECEVNNEDSDSPTKALYRMNCFLSLYHKGSVIIIDEAESLLSTRITLSSLLYGDSNVNSKGTVNKMLENNTNKVIWILNYVDVLDESTLRRFTYSIEFKEISREMLRTIADTKLNKIKMSESLHSQLVEFCG